MSADLAAIEARWRNGSTGPDDVPDLLRDVRGLIDAAGNAEARAQRFRDGLIRTVPRADGLPGALRPDDDLIVDVRNFVNLTRSFEDKVRQALGVPSAHGNEYALLAIETLTHDLHTERNGRAEAEQRHARLADRISGLLGQSATPPDDHLISILVNLIRVSGLNQDHVSAYEEGLATELDLRGRAWTCDEAMAAIRALRSRTIELDAARAEAQYQANRVADDNRKLVARVDELEDEDAAAAESWRARAEEAERALSIERRAPGHPGLRQLERNEAQLNADLIAERDRWKVRAEEAERRVLEVSHQANLKEESLRLWTSYAEACSEGQPVASLDRRFREAIKGIAPASAFHPVNRYLHQMQLIEHLSLERDSARASLERWKADSEDWQRRCAAATELNADLIRARDGFIAERDHWKARCATAEATATATAEMATGLAGQINRAAVARHVEIMGQTSAEVTPDGLPYPENAGQTHHDECWRQPKHHNCAVREAEWRGKRCAEEGTQALDLARQLNEAIQDRNALRLALQPHLPPGTQNTVAGIAAAVADLKRRAEGVVVDCHGYTWVGHGYTWVGQNYDAAAFHNAMAPLLPRGTMLNLDDIAAAVADLKRRADDAGVAVARAQELARELAEARAATGSAARGFPDVALVELVADLKRRADRSERVADSDLTEGRRDGIHRAAGAVMEFPRVHDDADPSEIVASIRLAILGLLEDLRAEAES